MSVTEVVVESVTEQCSGLSGVSVSKSIKNKHVQKIFSYTLWNKVNKTGLKLLTDIVSGKALHNTIVSLRVEAELEDAAGPGSAVLGDGKVNILLRC